MGDLVQLRRVAHARADIVALRPARLVVSDGADELQKRDGAGQSAHVLHEVQNDVGADEARAAGHRHGPVGRRDGGHF